MQSDVSLARIQGIISAFESIFFNAGECDLSIAKLHAESREYDSTYEAGVRRKELNHIILLDEILYIRHLSHLETADLLHELEKVLFAPDFYRDLVFGKPIAAVEPQFIAFQENVENNINIFSTMVSNETYRDLCLGFAHFNPPATKDAFIAELEKIDDALETIRQKLFRRVEPGIWLQASGEKPLR